ncbi:MAG: type IV pilus biogenesis/stability protein PilW [Methylophaga sp.]|nr:MAG: type IV pilus biogenesis/stability protein PilW [Methylophaga sp.]
MVNGIEKWILAVLMVATLAGCSPAGGTRPVEHVAPDPKAAEINMRLGLNYLQRGDYEIALEKLQKSLRQDPNLPSAHNTIAILYQRLGEVDKAEKHFKQAVSRDPKYSEAHNNYGVFLCQQHRYDESEKHFLQALKNPLYKSSAQALENAGVCVGRIPDIARAEKHFRNALQRNPNLAKSLIQMAKISYEQKDYIQSESYVKRYKAVSQWTASSLLIAIKTANQLDDQDAVSSYALLLRARFADSDEAQQVKNGQY